MFTRGGSDAAHAALDRSHYIAEKRGGALDQVKVLGPLTMFHLRTGDLRKALHCARRCSSVAATADDVLARLLARSVLGISLHLSGDLRSARAELEATLPDRSRPQPTTTIYLGFEGRSLAGAILARNLWLQGHPAQAVERARHTIEEAEGMEHSLTLSIALIWAISVFLWTGDLDSVEQDLDWLISRSESHSLTPYLAVGRGFRAELAIRRGDAKAGVDELQACLERLHQMPYELVTTPLNVSLVGGLAALGRCAEGMALLDDTIRQVEKNGNALYMPELLRTKAGLLLSMPEPRIDAALTCLKQSLRLSRRQGARAWELRAAKDLAALLAAQDRPDRARALLQPVFEQFDEGLHTADLVAAKNLLSSLG
jgi:tetratricopeptide (TPR) repeat protein